MLICSRLGGISGVQPKANIISSPICIGPLCPETPAHGEAGHGAGREAMVEVKGAALLTPRDAGGSGSNDVAEAPSAGARDSTASSAPVNPTSRDDDDESPASRAARLSRRLSMRRHKVSTERDVEILKLRSCGHWFHARCLSSWFLIDRYDCPVCRKSYWEGKSRRRGPMETFLRSEYTPTPTAARMGLGAMV